MKLKNHSRFLVALAFTVGVLGQSAPGASEDLGALFNRIAILRTADELSANADLAGTPIVDGNPTTKSVGSILHATAQLEDASETSLDELAEGRDLSFSYVAAPDFGIAAGYYIGHLRVDDPTRPESGGTWSLVGRDGEPVAEGSGVFDFAGQPDDPEELFGIDCEFSYGPGLDENGETCLNVVGVCEGLYGPWIWTGCMKSVE